MYNNKKNNNHHKSQIVRVENTDDDNNCNNNNNNGGGSGGGDGDVTSVEDNLKIYSKSIPTLQDLLGWNLYFPSLDINEPLHEKPDTERIHIENIYEFIKFSIPPFRYLCKDNLHTPDESNCIPLNYQSLKNQVFNNVPTIDEKLRDEPEIVLSCIGVAIYQVLYENLSVNYHPKKKINIRLFHFEPRLPLRLLNSSMIGKYVSIKGTIIRVGYVKPLVTNMTFNCAKCNEPQQKRFVEGRVVFPSQCLKRSCNSKLFEPDYTTATTIDWQKVTIQEDIEQRSGKEAAGGLPRNIDCELLEDLVDSAVPGDTVIISGIIKVSKVEDSFTFGKMKKNKAEYNMYLDVNSVENSKQSSSAIGSGGKPDTTTFSLKDIYLIRDIAEQPNLFHLIVNSICPSIYGHELVKAGLTLSLFGGNPKRSSNNPNDRSKMTTRSDPHMLIVGDPGLGKSHLLNAIHKLSQRGVYVTGGHTTTTGLTVSMARDSGSNGFALEAGALVLGDQGVCCIDEFDKMPKEHPALLEAMEQQSVSIAKAGVVCNLPARTSVIAAANPVGGHYNRAKTVSENIKMSGPLLSRFDLIFILLDKPSKESDRVISKHILDLHKGNTAGEKRKLNQRNRGPPPSSITSTGEKIPLKDRLVTFDNMETISVPLLRKYISYAKKYVFPTLSPEASKVIQDFYLELRARASKSDSTPVTTRQLESLIRLAEARAKVELRETILREDAEDIIEIMKESLFDTFEDEYGNIDFRRSSGMSKTNQAKKYISILMNHATKTGTKNFTRTEMFNLIKEAKLSLDSFDLIIDSLNNQGYILRQGNKFSLCSV
eukprot:gene6645-8222_t